MNKKTGFFLIILFAVFLGGLCKHYFSVKNVEQFYEVGDKMLNKPGCGFYIQVESDRKDKIKRYENETKLFLVTLDLYDCREQEIPAYKLDELEEFLEEAKSCNVKCIFRAAYGFEEKESNDADSLERIEEHIGQIAPVLNKYAEQIVCVQAGLFGPWGEWHSSKYLEGESARENRYWLTNLWVNNLNPEIVVALRRPSFIKEAVEDGIPIERIGLHNDGLMGSSTDLGTYEGEADRETELTWLEENLLAGFNGGEMPYVNEYSQPDRVLKEFPQMKISYLNMKYNEEVYENWKEQSIGSDNAYEYIAQRLGYRLYVSHVEYPEELQNDGLLFARKIVITLKNEGFAPLSGKYGLKWVIEDADGKQYMLDTDAPITELKYQEELKLKLPLWKVYGTDIKRIGIRIADENKNSNHGGECVELANDTFSYENGINYFLLYE